MCVRHLIFCVPLLCITGCSWLPFAIDNINGTTSNVIHEYKFKQQCKKLAELAWETTCQEPAHRNHRSSEFEKGFKAGFIDYLDYNGNGEPPGTLPRHLRNPILRNAEQQQDLFDWVAGFRLGASVAAQEQWRSRIVVPIPLPPDTRDEPFDEIIPRSGGRGIPGGGVPATASFESTAAPVDSTNVPAAAPIRAGAGGSGTPAVAVFE